MDIQHGPSMAIPMSSPDSHVGRRRSHSRSSSHLSADFESTRSPMTIPGARSYDVPPPLPPPTHLPDIEKGRDLVWHMENSGRDRNHGLPPIKEGSSLLGKFSQPRYRPGYKRGLDARKENGSNDSNGNNADDRQEPSTTTILASGTTDLGPGFPSVVRRAPSPTAANPMLTGEHPLAQRDLNHSNQIYDKTILSRIGKANSPPRHFQSESADSPVLGQKLSLQTKDMKVQQQPTPNESASTADSTGRWTVISPVSTGASPSSRQIWRDYNSDPQSPSMGSGNQPMALDPELFMQSQTSLHPSTGGAMATGEGTPNRSARSSYDPGMYTPKSESTEDTGATRHLEHEEQPSTERLSMRQGTKRKSPPSEGQAEDRAQRELYPKVATHLLPRSPNTSQPANYGSLSSTASSAQPSSYASSALLSAAPSSMTSVSSYGTQSPHDYPQNSPYAPSAGSMATATTNFAPRKIADRVVPRKVSLQTPPQEIRPAPARIGNHYICACCPKKPKKFETEEQLRVHENEKQYSCNFCHNRFKNKNEAERHQNSLHLRRHSWSCAALVNYEAAFSQSGAIDSSSAATDACGFCGEEFPNHPAPDWPRRLDHLTNVHKFGECNSTKKFFRADHFRQHLKHSHAGRSGKWTNILEHACVKDEIPAEAGQFSISTGESHQAPVARPGTSMTASMESPVRSEAHSGRDPPDEAS